MFGVASTVIVRVSTNYVSVRITPFLLGRVGVAVSIFDVSKFILSMILGG